MALTDEDRQFIVREIDAAIDRHARNEMLTVAEIMHLDKIKTAATVKRRAKEAKIPQRTIGGGIRTSDKEPLRYSRSEWRAGQRKHTRSVKRLADSYPCAAAA